MENDNWISILGATECYKAATTRRGIEENYDDCYSGFSVCNYTGDDALHIDNCLNLLTEATGAERIVMPRQVHGTEVIVLTDLSELNVKEADALVTNISNIIIGVNTADCVPVIMVDSNARVAAAVHAGWRGALAGIVEGAFKKMELLGANAPNVEAFIAPCIHQCCFEVGEEVASLFPEYAVNRLDFTKPHVDLVKYVAEQIKGLGVENITIHPDCTRCHPDQYFSARALGTKSGRNFTFVQLRPRS